MELAMSLMDMSGDTELTFRDDHVRVKWGKTTPQERKLIVALVEKAEKSGLKAFLVDEDGKAVETKAEDEKSPGASKTVRTVEAELEKKAGELILKGEKKGVKVVAKDLVEAEIKRGHIVMQAQKDNTWKILKAEEFEPDKAEAEAVTSKKPVGGG